MPDLPAIDWPLNEKAVYWAPKNPDMDSSPAYESPIEIDCRWDEDAEEVLIQGSTDKYSNLTEVMVDRRLKKQGVLWYGKLVDVTDSARPMNNEGAGVIRRCSRTPNIDADEALYTAYL